MKAIVFFLFFFFSMVIVAQTKRMEPNKDETDEKYILREAGKMIKKAVTTLVSAPREDLLAAFKDQKRIEEIYGGAERKSPVDSIIYLTLWMLEVLSAWSGYSMQQLMGILGQVYVILADLYPILP